MTHSKPNAPLLYLGDALAAYGFGNDHPFGPDRMAAFRAEAERRGLLEHVHIMPPVMAEAAAIGRFHTQDYIERVKKLSKTGEGFLDQGDTPAFVGMFEAASTVAGSVLDAANRLMHGEAKRAFVPIAGLHHARRDGAAGFCVFNDCGIVIEHLKQVHGLARIAYVDIDIMATACFMTSRTMPRSGSPTSTRTAAFSTRAVALVMSAARARPRARS